ncbi:MAG: response regulator transcription factor [Sphingobacteriales bacterium]|nr:MAG: response regulator transcription factor [Sphingobacteriales bacterium]
MKRYTVIIVDDEPIARTILESYIRQTPSLQLGASVATIADLLQALEQQRVDLLLLDIHLKNENSLQALRKTPDLPKIIFVTANKEYAVESYELEAVDYLLKPVSLSRFEKAIDKFIRQESGDPESILPEPQPATRLYFKTTTGFINLAPDEILYVEARRDYIQIMCASRNLLVNMTMKALEEKLQPHPEFIRIHKSYLINKTQVRGYDRRTVRIRDLVLPIGDRFRKTFQPHWPK